MTLKTIKIDEIIYKKLLERKKAAKLHLQLKARGQEIDIFNCLIAAIIETNEYKKIISKKYQTF
jgi:predicted nucleic acid-binding protein